MTEHSAELGELGKALAKAQAAMKGAKKDSANPFFKSSYADLSSVWEACREALTANGLSIAQFPGFEGGIATVDTVLLHSSGQWISGKAGAPIGKQDAQGVGSALTYLRRYALAAVAGVTQEDDDGNAASQRAPAKRPAARSVGQPTSPGAKASGGNSSPAAGPTEPLNEKPAAIVAAEKEPMPWDGQPLKWKNKALGDFESKDLIALRDFCEKKDPTKYAAYLTEIEELLAGREGL